MLPLLLLQGLCMLSALAMLLLPLLLLQGIGMQLVAAVTVCIAAADVAGYATQ